jgi:PAS domain S-box-containing protein
MKKINYFLWYFPLCFLLFIAIYMSVKFIFIYFFRAAFEPTFMFDLTPYYLLSGVNNLHLILLSLIVIWFSVYFHVKVNKRNLLLSFLLTGIMLAGLGVRIASGEMAISDALHYLVFGCLLVITLIDHKHFLMFPEIIVTPKKEPVFPKAILGKPIISKAEPKAVHVPAFEKPIRIEGIDEILTLHKETLLDLRTLIKDDLQRAEAMMEKLDEKTGKIDRLGDEIEERRKNLVQEERLFRRRFISSLGKDIHVKSFGRDDESSLDVETGEGIHDQHTMLDDILESAAVVQRGILKQVNQPFVELLGHETDMLLETSLLNFIAPEGLSGIEGYYLNRLKGETISTYKTVFLTKDNNKLAVEISIRPTIFNGKKAEIAVIKKLDKKEENKKLK